MTPKQIDISDNDFGAVLTCAIRYCMGRRTYMPSLVIDFIIPLLPQLSDNALDCFQRDLSEPQIYGGLGDKEIDEPKWIDFKTAIADEINKRKEEKVWRSKT